MLEICRNSEKVGRRQKCGLGFETFQLDAAQVKEMAERTFTPEPVPRPPQHKELTQMDRLALVNDEPRVLKAHISHSRIFAAKFAKMCIYAYQICKTFNVTVF